MERVFGIVLDLDGLLLDTERLQFEVAPAVLASFGHDIEPEFFRSLVGVDRIESARRINLVVDGAIDSVALDQAWTAAMDERMQQGIPLRPGVADFLDALDKASLPRAIATNSVTARAEWKLQHAGLLSRVGPVVGVDQVAKGKPAPDVYIEATRRLGVDPSSCAALDDSDLGVQSAIAAGIGMVIQIPDLSPSTKLQAHHQVLSLLEAQILLDL